MSRRAWAEIKRRKSASGIVGVRKVTVRKGRGKLAYWIATWSPRPHVVRRKMFSVLKFGAAEAKALAVKARRAGIQSMKD
jgi:hypothetical protein